MILLVLIEIALLCVVVLLIRVAIRRGLARVLQSDDDFGDEIQPTRVGARINNSVEGAIKVVPATGEK